MGSKHGWPSKNRGGCFYPPQIIHLFIGFSMKQIIHVGVPGRGADLFWIRMWSFSMWRSLGSRNLIPEEMMVPPKMTRMSPECWDYVKRNKKYRLALQASFCFRGTVSIFRGRSTVSPKFMWVWCSSCILFEGVKTVKSYIGPQTWSVTVWHTHTHQKHPFRKLSLSRDVVARTHDPKRQVETHESSQRLHTKQAEHELGSLESGKVR